MKFTTAKEHRDFFQKHKMLEVEDLIPSSQLPQIVAEIKSELSKRLKISSTEVLNVDPMRIYNSGRDLWRSSSSIKKLITSKPLAEIAAEIFDKKPLRLGFDQLFPPIQEKTVANLDNPYIKLLNHPSSLEGFACLQGIICGLMLCLEGESETSKIGIWPKKAGNGVYFSPQVLMNLSDLLPRANQLNLLIVFTRSKAVYIHTDVDPNGYLLRDIGYAFGDQLIDRKNPIVFR